MKKINFDLSKNLINENFKELTDKINSLVNEMNQLKKQNKELTNKINKLEDKNNIFNSSDVHYLYYIVNGDENRFKIGITQNLESRLASLQTANHKPIKLITKVIGEKEEIVKLEKKLKNKMNNYNVSGEWFEMDYEKRQSLLNYLNRLNYNFYIDENKINEDKTNENKTNENKTNEDEINKNETNKDETNKDETNKDETNKDENEVNENKTDENETNKNENEVDKNETKLSSLKIEKIIALFKENGLVELNKKLVFLNNLTNQMSTDYDYFLDNIDNIKNDLKNKEIKDLFKKLNKEYIVCFDELKYYNDNNSFKTMLSDLEIPSIEFFYGIKRKDLFKLYKNDYFGKKEIPLFEDEILNLNNCEFKIKNFTFKNKKTYVVNSVLCPKDKNKEKAIKEFYLKWSNFFDSKNKYNKLNILSISELFKKMNRLNDDSKVKQEFDENVKKIIELK